MQSAARSLRHLRKREKKTPSASIIRNKGVFDLGVLPIELCFNKSLEQMQTPNDLDDFGKLKSYTSLATANRLIPEVYTEAGIRYVDAVRRYGTPMHPLRLRPAGRDVRE